MGNAALSRLKPKHARRLGTLTATFTVKTEHRYRVGPNKMKAIELHTVRCFGRWAEIARDYLSEGAFGRMIVVEGTVRYKKVTDKVSDKKYKVAEIYANNFQMIGRAEDRNEVVAVEPAEFDPDEVIAE